MSDPRAAISNIGTGYRALTFAIDNSTITYLATEAGEHVLGKLISVGADNFATVQVGGVCTLPSGAGATLTLGEKIVGDLDTAAKGYIRAVATGTAGELGHARGAIHNNNTTTAVVVDLDG